MDKILFNASSTDLFAEDYDYLQNKITDEFAKTFRQFIENAGVPAIVKGFDIRIHPSDSTKIQLYHDTNTSTGTFATDIGYITESSSGLISVTMSSYVSGTTNYIYAYHYLANGSYDRDNLVVLEGQQNAVDFSDYSLDYDRQVNKWGVVALTAAEYAALSSTSTGSYVLLGTVKANGAGSALTNLDLSGRVYTRTFIGDGSIDVSQLVSGFLLPQTNVDNSDTINDLYYGTPADLQDDLNKIRTQIKNIKLTTTWDETVFGVTGTSPFTDKLHRTGVMEGYEDDLDYTLTSSGTSIIIKKGKYLYQDTIVTISTETTLNFSTLTTYQVGDISTNTGYETSPLLGSAPDTYTLAHTPLRNLVVTEDDASPLVYDNPDDYTYNATTGVVTTTSTGDIQNETVRNYYEYGESRCDAIVSDTATGSVSIIEGTGTTGLYPTPPAIPDDHICLYFIYRPNLSDNIVLDDYIVSNFIYTEPVREIREIAAQSTTDFAMYRPPGASFDDKKIWEVHRLAVVTSTGIGLANNAGQWAISSSATRIYDATVKVNSIIYTREDDELWISVKSHSSDITITLDYEGTPGSGTLDQSTSTTTPPATAEMTDQFYLIPLEKGFSEGYHKIQISFDTATHSVFNKLIVGKLDNYYSSDYMYVKDIIASGDMFLVKNRIQFTNSENNTAVGSEALSSNTTGARNTAVGRNALSSNTWGMNNVAVGVSSLQNNSSGYQNTAIGYDSLSENTIGTDNTAVGNKALEENIIGTHNTAIGSAALDDNTDGNENTAVGASALGGNTLGDNNVAVGRSALLNNTTGNNNTAIGHYALFYNDGGLYNVAVGKDSLSYNTQGSYNTAIGYLALFNNTEGDYNVAIGKSTLENNTTGLDNIAVGNASLNSNTTGNYNIGIGSGALASNDGGDFNIAIGKDSQSNNTHGSYNISLGVQSLENNISGTHNVCIGYNSGKNIEGASGIVAIGANVAVENTYGHSLIAVGANALEDNITGNYNIGIGSDALRYNITGSRNTTIGWSAGRSIEGNSMSDCVAVGCGALSIANAGSHNVAVGVHTMEENVTGAYNTAVGNYALEENTFGKYNTAIGYGSIDDNISGNYNTVVGYQAGTSAVGSNNTIIGALAATALTAGSNVTCIGYNAEPSSSGATDEITLGDSNITSLRCQVDITVLSDERDKADLVQSTLGLGFISKLTPVKFKWDKRKWYKERGKELDGSLKKESWDIGILAQKVSTAIKEEDPELVGAVVKTYQNTVELTPGKLIYPLITAVQELAEKIEVLEKRVDKIKVCD